MTDAKTKGLWGVEPHDDGSWWVVGPDPQDGRKVCVAAFEMEQDARHVAELHNERCRDVVEGRLETDTQETALAGR